LSLKRPANYGTIFHKKQTPAGRERSPPTYLEVGIRIRVARSRRLAYSRLFRDRCRFQPIQVSSTPCFPPLMFPKK
jgi:hypothetical protein